MKNKNLTLKDFGVKREERILKNGCRVVLYEKKNSPLFMRACFLAGSRFEPQGKEGLAHLVEHLLVSKTKKFESKDKLTMFLERYGGSFSLSTNNNFININGCIGDILDVDVLINFFNEVINNTIFNQKNFLAERGSIFNEIGNLKNSPSEFFNEIFLDTFYKGTPLERGAWGTEEGLKNIKLKDTIDFYNKNITPQNCTIIASGDIKIDELIKKIEQKIKFKNEGENKISKTTCPIPTKGERVFVKNVLSNQSIITVGFRVGSRFNYSLELEIIAFVLAGTRASRLNKKLRNDKGLIYSISSGYNAYQDAGGFFFRTTTNQYNAEEVIRTILLEVEKIRKNGVTQEELSFIKDKIYKSIKRKLQTSEDWINDNYYLEVLSKNGETGIDLINKIMKVSNKDIIRIANKYFSKEKAYIGLYSKGA